MVSGNEVKPDRKVCKKLSQKVCRLGLAEAMFSESRCPGRKY